MGGVESRLEKIESTMAGMKEDILALTQRVDRLEKYMNDRFLLWYFPRVERYSQGDKDYRRARLYIRSPLPRHQTGAEGRSLNLSSSPSISPRQKIA